MALTWFDPVLTPDITHVKKRHIQEIRDYIDTHVGSGLVTQHPLATAVSAGFMSSAHFSLLASFQADWVTSGNGVMTIAATLPVRATTGANPVISIDLATASDDGAMSSAHYTKLEGIATGANLYVHPGSHSASIITETATRVFVTPTEKANWNAKQGALVPATQLADGLLSSTDKTKLDSLDGFPAGTVIMYSSILEAKDIGWWFNTNNGEPLDVPNSTFYPKWRILNEMSSRFPLSAGGTTPEGDEGGEKTHQLTLEEMPKHKHPIKGQNNSDIDNERFNPNSGGTVIKYTELVGGGTLDEEGECTPHNNMPPYYSLWFLVKIED